MGDHYDEQREAADGPPDYKTEEDVWQELADICSWRIPGDWHSECSGSKFAKHNKCHIKNCAPWHFSNRR